MAVITPQLTLYASHWILFSMEQILSKKQSRKCAWAQINSNLDMAGGWAAFRPYSFATESSIEYSKVPMESEKVILVQGWDLKLRILLKLGSWGKGARKFHSMAKKYRKAACLCGDLVKEIKIKQTQSCEKAKLYAWFYVWVWKWSLHYPPGDGIF